MMPLAVQILDTQPVRAAWLVPPSRIMAHLWLSYRVLRALDNNPNDRLSDKDVKLLDCYGEMVKPCYRSERAYEWWRTYLFELTARVEKALGNPPTPSYELRIEFAVVPPHIRQYKDAGYEDFITHLCRQLP